jgi:hypothetical protein
MGFYEERPPRHGHRTPSELAEDEILSALHGDFCGMPEAKEEPRPATDAKCVRLTHVALLPWADAHPLTATLAKQPRASSGRAPTPATTLRERTKRGRKASHDDADS